MKYILLFLMLFSFTKPLGFKVVAEESNKHYARIKNMGVYLYKSENGTTDNLNIMFLLENTYFVELLEDTNENYYKAKYLNATGYVKKSDVQCVKGSPVNPFATNISFRVFAQNGINIRSTPEASKGLSNTLGTIPYLENNITYYGKVTGEEAIPFRGNTWYYCSYLRNGIETMGYVYSGYCDLLSTINLNLEVMEEIEKAEFTKSTNSNISDGDTDGSILPGVSRTNQILIIIAVCIPGFIIIYLLFKPSLKNDKENKKSKNKKLDYFVFEDDEFN